MLRVPKGQLSSLADVTRAHGVNTVSRDDARRKPVNIRDSRERRAVFESTKNAVSDRSTSLRGTRLYAYHFGVFVDAATTTDHPHSRDDDDVTARAARTIKRVPRTGSGGGIKAPFLGSVRSAHAAVGNDQIARSPSDRATGRSALRHRRKSSPRGRTTASGPVRGET